MVLPTDSLVNCQPWSRRGVFWGIAPSTQDENDVTPAQCCHVTFLRFSPICLAAIYRPGISEYLQFKQRTQLNTETGDVTVSRVTPADSGLYEAEIIIDGKIKSFTQQVDVIDPVRNIRISCNETGSTVTLVCEADGPLLSYSWTGPGLQNPENRNPIQISEENLGSSYTCLVKNPVSEEKQSYTAGDCSTRDRTIFLVGSVVGSLLLLLILLVLVLVVLLVFKRPQSRRGKCSSEPSTADRLVMSAVSILPQNHKTHYNKESDEERTESNQDMDQVQEGEKERCLNHHQPDKKKEVKQKHGDVYKSKSNSINVDLSIIEQGNTENYFKKYQDKSPEELRITDETSEPVRQEFEDKNQQPNKETDTSDEDEEKRSFEPSNLAMRRSLPWHVTNGMTSLHNTRNPRH
ncbi:SLAM family member 5-like [Denticeps clupeoides]|uniref:SLAM family member 5-like n=1 Tax=Denticeps clupeoides TaxID=299321 RepID=UPI0010A382E6|nr:SLAM family member 5-like [Denticeps clupeoides]